MKEQAFLSNEQLSAVLDSFSPDQVVSVVRIRYKNRQEIRTRESFRVEHLRAFIELCSTERHQPGGDLELEVPALGKTLVGHHDGLYWLEKSKGTDLASSSGDAQQSVKPDGCDDAAPVDLLLRLRHG